MNRRVAAKAVLATAVFFVAVLPVYQMILVSFLPQRAILDSPLVPNLKDLTLQNYVRTLSNGVISGRIYLNSAIVGLVTMLLGTSISALAGYSLTRYRFLGSRLVDRFILLAYVVPPILQIGRAHV